MAYNIMRILIEVTEVIEITSEVLKLYKQSINDFIDKKDFDGPLLEQIDGAYKFVLEHINMAIEINGIVHDEIYELPIQAIRELIINAVIHRNYMMNSSVQVAVYDDRVEISSPGSLYGSLTLQEALSGRSSIRNKILAENAEE